MGTGIQRPCIVISAVNFVEGGPLSILQDCLAFASEHLSDQYDIVVLVHRASLFNCPRLRFIEYLHSKRSWLARLYHEYWLFRPLSLELNPVLWLSLHDMTPNVVAQRRAVYCHNPAPFYRLTLRDVWLEPGFAVFNLFYRWLYQINIQMNDYVIVQQDWLRSRFENNFGLRNVVVAYPEFALPDTLVASDTIPEKNVCRFVYPAFPRVFKNFEVIGEAARILAGKGIEKFEVLLTIDGSETRYAQAIFEHYRNVKPLRFIGLQSRQRVFDLYRSSDCLIFPSKLETWGLPITEFKSLRRPILAANLEYAHETVGNYSCARFFDPDNADELADQMLSVINSTFLPEKVFPNQPAMPFTQGWKQLFALLLEQHGSTKVRI